MMGVRILCAIMPVFLSVCASLTADAGESATTIPVAREWCDTEVLSPVEGIWEYPADGVVVLIRRNGLKASTYDITVLESEDPRLGNGICIGHLIETPEKDCFRLSQYRLRKGDILTGMIDCVAKLTSDKGGITVSAPKLRFRMNPSILLPGFWKIVRFSLTAPTDNIPVGLVRRYPLDYGDRHRRAL